jgi:hypothetical protein
MSGSASTRLVTSADFTAAVPGGVIAGVRSGTGFPLPVLHGGPGVSDYSSLLVGELDGWAALRYTQRGVTPSTASGPFTIEQHVADAIAVLDQHDVGSAAVLRSSVPIVGQRCGRRKRLCEPARTRTDVSVSDSSRGQHAAQEPAASACPAIWRLGAWGRIAPRRGLSAGLAGGAGRGRRAGGC